MSESGKLGKVPSERLAVTRHGNVIEPGSSGLQPDGTWEPAFPGQRPPFAEGNGAALIHGARASVERLLPEAQPLADELVPLVPSFTESDRPAVLLTALTLRRISRSEPVIAEAEETGDLERVESLMRSQRAWVGHAVKLLDALGMTPTARARLGLDLARGVSVLEQYVEHAYGPPPAGELSTAVDTPDVGSGAYAHEPRAVEEGGS